MAIIKSARIFRAAIIALMGAHALAFITGCDSSTKTVPRARLAAHNTPAAAAVPEDTLRRNAANALDNLPLRFEQVSSDANFLARGAGFELSIEPTEAVMRMHIAKKRENELPPASARVPNRSAQKVEQASLNSAAVTSLRMQLVGANRRARVLGENKVTTRTNYFLGNDPSRWSRALPNYSRVRVTGIYRDIDVVYYGAGRQVEYDFNVAPGADYKAIRLRFTGARRITIDESGDLVLDTTAGQIRQRKPVAYQVVDNSRRGVPARFVMTGDREVSFFVDHYDERLAMVIDPVLSYSTYFGGQRSDSANSVAVDASGNVYITGSTFSFDFPLKGSVQGHTQAFSGDIFIAKLNASGTELIYSTIVGGSGVDIGASIAVDAAGNAWIVGSTTSADLPTTPGVIQTALAGGRDFDAFVLKLSADGSDLSYSTYLGGGDGQSFSSDGGNGIAIDSSGNAYVTGQTHSLNFPTTAGALKTTGDQLLDAFVSKINATGTVLLYSTYLGGTGHDEGIDIAVNALGNAFITGYTSSADFPVTSGAFQTAPGRDSRVSLSREDAFIAKLNLDGSALVYSTYLGGFRMDLGYAIAVDAEDNAYVAGSTQSPNLPTTAGSFKTEYEGGFYRSGNAGEGWRLRNSGLAVPLLRGLAVDPKTPSNLYLRTDEGLYKSSDGGDSWTRTTSFGFSDLVIDPVNPSTLYGGLNGVSKSTDGGLTWAPVSTGLPSMFSARKLLIDPLNPSTIYVVGFGFLFVAQEQSSQIDAQIQEPPPTPRFFFKSTDAGQSWQEVRSLLLFDPPSGFAMDPQEPGRLFVSIGTGPLFRTQNGGDSWRNINNDPVFAPLVVDSRTTGTLYGGASGGLVKSTDDGKNWSAINNGLPAELEVTGLVAIPTTPTTLYAASSLGLFKSTNAGASWQQSAIEGRPEFIAFNPQNPSIVYTGINDSSDAFVAKLNSTGSALLYCTYLGGRSADQASDIAVDGSGNAYVTGHTFSNTIATQGALQDAKPNTVTLTPFVTKLNQTGAALLFSTYFGGTKLGSSGQSIALSPAGDVYVTGWTESADFPTKNALQSSAKGDLDSFLFKLGAPRISGASISGNKLIIAGDNFDQGATLLINGEEQKTKSDEASPITRLIGKKAGKRIQAGQTVRIRVRNSDATLSNELNFSR